MQLILDTEPTIDITRNMSTLNEEMLAEKLDDVIEDLKSGLCNGNKENIQCQKNIISSDKEPNSENEKIEEVVAAKSAKHDQSVDITPSHSEEITETAVKSPNHDDVSEIASKSRKPDDISEMVAKSPKPDDVTEMAANLLKPDDVTETAAKSELVAKLPKLDDVTETAAKSELVAKSPKPDDVTETAAKSPKPDDVIETAVKSPEPDVVTETAAKSPKPDDVTETAVKSPKPDDVTETAAKSPIPDDITETAAMSPKPNDVIATGEKLPKTDDFFETDSKSQISDENTVIENVFSEDKQSANENVDFDKTDDEKIDINIKDLEGTTDRVSTKDISLRMEEDSPAVVDDQAMNDEESDPIIIPASWSNGQEEEIEKNEEIFERTNKADEEITEKDLLNKSIGESNLEINDTQAETADENMEVVDQVHDETAQIAEEDKACLNRLEEVCNKKEEDYKNTKEIEDDKIDGICLNGKDQDVPEKVDDVNMQDDILENNIQSSLQELTSHSCDTKAPNEKKVTENSSSEINKSNISKSSDALKEIETVDLDDKDNLDKSLRTENSVSELSVQNPIENGSVSGKNDNSIAEMETVDLIDEKDGSGLETMDVDINVETSEEKPISLSSEKDDIFDCEDNLDEMVLAEETETRNLSDKIENVELKNNVSPMDEDVQPVDDKNSHKASDTKKEETINIPDDEVKEQESKSEDPAKETSQTSNLSNIATEQSKTIPSVLKLSNTLNILSDDEDETTEPTKTETSPQNTDKGGAAENKCINIEDDDDIMLIDEEDNSKEIKSEPAKPEVQTSDAEPKVDEQEKDMKIDEQPSEISPNNAEKTTESPSEVPIEKEKTEDEKVETISEAKPEAIKPLVPTNFLKTCKKNMAEMTRDDLEEFCILKIVESVVDRSSLSEIKTKLKSMAHCIEEYKKKAQMLQKQNRDLQVVLKTIQEEQKNSKTVTPLKITRSVGMQVLMTERSTIRRKPSGPGANSNNTTPTKTPSPRTPNQRPIKVPASPSPQQIPVPRLVPASNSPAAKNNMPQINATSKAASPINGVRSNAQKAEKRGINRNHSVTVDLTDDEPPAKIMNRNSTPTPLRVVPPHMVPQNLLAATPRHPIAQTNNPRKVYIPISGPQNQNIRAGQAIMLKSVTAPNQIPRPRGPQPHINRMPQNQIRMPRVQNRHPAPLPESTKQYPGTYLKALPPAPDLKLSKVENGIVISWKIEGYQEDSYEEIASYQLYAYQETNSPPSTALWKKIGDVKALPLPMACTLTQFMAGFKYYFAVRAVDIRSRIGPFSLPGSILLLNKL